MNKLIKTESEYDAAMERHLELMLASPEPDTAEFNELELLTLLIQTYEKETVDIEDPTPIEAIRFRMEQMGLKQKDLIPHIGSKARVSEILSGKRPLTIPMARNLHQDLGIPASVLLADERAELPKEIDVSTYPVKEMHNYGWFPQYEGKTWQSVKCHAEDMLHSLLEPFKDSPVRAFNRAGFKEDAQLNESALYAWRCRVLTESEKQKLSEFDTEDLTEEFISSLVNITQFDDGPRMAIELLAQRGIAVVIMQHLPKTYLDGAALRNRKGNPVIGLTLRHDRLDNFWFTLFHELGHVKMHLEQNPDGFFDDTESNDNKKEEGEANSFALNHLIPHDQWGILRETIKKTAEIRKEAKRLAIHPAIIAGRLRNEFQSYSKFRTLIGQGEVRSLLLQ